MSTGGYKVIRPSWVVVGVDPETGLPESGESYACVMTGVPHAEFSTCIDPDTYETSYEFSSSGGTLQFVIPPEGGGSLIDEVARILGAEMSAPEESHEPQIPVPPTKVLRSLYQAVAHSDVELTEGEARDLEVLAEYLGV